MRYLLTLPVFLLVSGCATLGLSPEYKPYENTYMTRDQGGYSDFPISKDQFCISYIGHYLEGIADNFSLSSKEKYPTTRKNAVRRASEVTLQHGYRYFVITSEHDKLLPAADRKLHTVTFTIQCFDQNPPQGAIDAYTRTEMRG